MEFSNHAIRETRKFLVVVVQKRQRNVQNSVMPFSMRSPS